VVGQPTSPIVLPESRGRTRILLTRESRTRDWCAWQGTGWSQVAAARDRHEKRRGEAEPKGRMWLERSATGLGTRKAASMSPKKRVFCTSIYILVVVSLVNLNRPPKLTGPNERDEKCLNTHGNFVKGSFTRSRNKWSWHETETSIGAGSAPVQLPNN
jgi:hypothetical protein